MKKTLIALAVLGVAGVAHAQSNVTIYGTADIGYVKQSHKSVTMNERDNNRLGFMGQEDLGGGLKATFQLESRFKLQAGVGSTRGDFEGAANVGLMGNFGKVSFGRVNELSTETYRRLDPFNQYGVAAMLPTPLRGNDTEGRLSYTARYDSPNFNGFKLGATYTVKNNADAVGTNGGISGSIATITTLQNNGYALSGTYTNGPMYLVANYNVAVDSNKSRNWNVGGAYAFGPVKVSAGYEATTNKNSASPYLYEDQKNWLVGLSYVVGAGVINASYNSSEWDNSGADASKWAIGYTHNLSKRTSVYANYSHVKYETGLNGTATVPYKTKLGGTSTDLLGSSSAVEVGITHKF
jgi:predicted porin